MNAEIFIGLTSKPEDFAVNSLALRIFLNILDFFSKLIFEKVYAESMVFHKKDNSKVRK